MALPTFYATGTVSVTNGATTVTGSGTGWGGDVILPGDLFMDPAQPEIPPQRIASVTDGTHLELAVGWPGTDMSADAYEIRFVGDIVRSTAQSRRYLEMAGQLTALGLQPDAFGEFADRDAYDDEAAGFVYLSLDGDGVTGVWTLYIKETATSGDWDAGQQVPGEPGPQGEGLDYNAHVDAVADLDDHDDEAAGFRVLVNDVGDGRAGIYTLVTPGSPGTWEGPAYVTGPAGADGADGANGTNGQGVPTGGTAGQALVKASGTDFDTAWATRREVLTANRTYYVRTDGNDGNTGLTNTSGGAFLTVQKALNVAAALDCSTYNVTIQVADGTYAGGIALPMMLGSGTFSLLGNTTTPANVVLSTGINAQNCGKWLLDGFVNNSGSSWGITAVNAYIQIGRLVFPTITGATHLYAGPGAFVEEVNNYSITGGSGFSHINVNGGFFQAFSRTVTLTGTPGFTNFVSATLGGAINSGSMTYSGAATGSRYSATLNGVIQTGGGGASYFPGNAAGSTSTGGQYA